MIGMSRRSLAVSLRTLSRPDCSEPALKRPKSFTVSDLRDVEEKCGATGKSAGSLTCLGARCRGQTCSEPAQKRTEVGRAGQSKTVRRKEWCKAEAL